YMITTVTEHQPITVPMELVKLLRLQPGTQLDWSVESDGTLVARPVLSRAERARQAAGMGRAWLKPGQSAVEELIAERADEDIEFSQKAQ
ncbi:MAG: AbrB/MazE/SpoVT family DNA-binding domain-containing protein, partial [Caldilineaceae bacterium]|nr:AbrB/MazE/SpoVT family DNA-binding domain-containing protein [Caldilineaceae bacterium]